MKQPRKRKRGGQPKPAAQRKRNNITIRLLDDLRDNLEKASRASGRSMSEEIAWRVTLTFLMNTQIQDLYRAQAGTLKLLRQIVLDVNAKGLFRAELIDPKAVARLGKALRKAWAEIEREEAQRKPAVHAQDA